MNAKTREAIERHGRQLLALFPGATEQNPVALCKKLRRIETVAHRISERLCGDSSYTYDQADADTAHVMRRVTDLLGLVGVDGERAVCDCGLFVNRYPRGYALKVSSDWAHDRDIYRDWGGYGILAPDLNEKD